VIPVQSRLMATTHYCKKYGIMCCIVLKTYYLCDVIEKNRIDLSQKSIAMNKLFFAKIFTTPFSAGEGCSEVKTLKP
jgi:hypothetical protein